ATLWMAGYPRAKQGRPGCRVQYYTGLTFVHFDDPANTCDNQTRRATVKNYQAVGLLLGVLAIIFLSVE
ncbi:MAG: hypothetical protein ACRDHW_17000, partial [Ktedonobacteraceae bacterium]